MSYYSDMWMRQPASQANDGEESSEYNVKRINE